MSVQVARSGQVILTLGSLEELRDEVDAGRVLPTDHYIVVGMPSWRPVSSLPAEPMAPIARREPDLAETVRAQVEQARAQVLGLMQARPFPKPSQCKHCGGGDLRSAKLVWQQSTKVGGAIDTDFDITVFGTSTLQGLDLTPPPEPRMPTESSPAGCLTIFVSVIVFMFVFDLIMLPFIFWIEGIGGLGHPATPGDDPGLLERGAVLLLAALAVYVAFRAARGVYRWDKRRSGGMIDSDCAVQLERAKVFARWRNTWICMSCGGRNIVVE